MDALPERIRSVLAGFQTMVLATAGADGQPEAASVFFAAVGDAPRFVLICAMQGRSAKLARLGENPRVGFFIGPQTPSRWLQGTGIAEAVQGDAECARLLELLVADAPGARLFVERVPVVAVVIAVRQLKLTDLTGERPPIMVMDFDS